jgi:hypothetical protein
VKKLMCLLASIMAISFFGSFSSAQAAVVPACQVEDPPANCEDMWAVIAHVRLPKQPIAVITPNPRCEPKFSGIDWGRTVADGFLAEVDREQLEKLAMDVSDALQRKLVPQIARHIRGDAAIFIADYFSKLAPRAWSLSGYDQALCAPVIAAVPANATVRGFRYRAWDENRGEMDCAAGSLECAIGHSRFFKGCASRPAETSMDGITLYTAIFQNWSTDRAREGRLIIFFELPAGQVPVSQI